MYNYCTQFLSSCSAGERFEEAEETSASRPEESAFQIVGTLSASAEDEKEILFEQYVVSQAQTNK